MVARLVAHPRDRARAARVVAGTSARPFRGRLLCLLAVRDGARRRLACLLPRTGPGDAQRAADGPAVQVQIGAGVLVGWFQLTADLAGQRGQVEVDARAG